MTKIQTIKTSHVGRATVPATQSTVIPNACGVDVTE
jgi:hypothetical protein